MKKIILSALLVTLLYFTSFAQTGSQPGEKKGWPSSERYSFITECVKAAKAGMSEDSARFYCYCMQEKMELKYPTVEEAAKFSREDLESSEWKKNINTCMTGGSWSSNFRADFLSECVKSAKESLKDEAKAKNYCECMMFKVEQKLPSEADAAKISTEDLKKPEWVKVIKGCMTF